MKEESLISQDLSKTNNDTCIDSSEDINLLAKIMGSLETGRMSPLHYFFRFSLEANPYRVAILTASLLFLVFFLGPFAITISLPYYFSMGSILPPFPGWDAFFVTAISIPIIGGIVVSERNAIPLRFAALARSGTLKMSPDKAKEFCKSWKAKYKRINIIAIVVSIIGAIGYVIIIWIDARHCTDSRWSVVNGVPTNAGYLWIFWQTPAAAFIAFTFVVRLLSIIFLLYSLSPYVEMELFHPDECGGLQEIGRLCFRNQIGVMVIGLNILVNTIVCLSNSNLWTVMPAAVLYILIGPFGFLGPLTPFRKNMLKTRNKELERINNRLYQMHKNLLGSLDKYGVQENEAKAIQRVLDIRERIKNVPVWPFDASTLRKFIVAYLFPIVSAITSTFGGDIFSYLTELATKI